MNQRSRTPAWIWLAVGLSLLILGLWLAYFLLVNAPQLPTREPTAIPAAIVAPTVADAATSIVPSDGTGQSGEALIDASAVEEALQPTDTPVTPAIEDAEPVMASSTGLDATPTTQTVVAPTATSTPEVSDRLALGAEQYRLGDYAAAREQYQSLLNSETATSEQRLQAQFELAKAQLAEGLPADALTRLAQLETSATTGGADAQLVQELLAMAEYLRAEALSGLGRYEEAAVAYERFLAAFPSAAATVQPKLGRVYLLRGDIESGENAFYAAVQATTDPVHRVLLLEELAALHTNAGRHTLAAAAWDAILDIAQKPNYRALVFNKAAYSHAAAGDESTAITRWQSAIAEAQSVYRSQDSSVTESIRSSAIATAYDALVELVNRNVDFDLYERGLIDLEAEAYAPAINAFSAYLESVADDDVRASDALHGLAKSHLGLGQFAEAEALFNRVLNEYPACDCFGEVMLDMAQLRAAQGDRVAARRAYRTFARDYPNDPLAPVAMWRSGLSALNEGLDVEGAVDFVALADAFPSSELAPQALFWVGTGAYRNGLYGDAAGIFARMQREYPDYRWDAVAFWLGRAQHELGDFAAANETWAALVERAPDIYYGILAAYSKEPISLTGGSMLTAMGAIAGPPTRLAGDDGSQRFADEWVANWLQVDPATVSVLPDYVENDADLETGRLLLELDARGDALEALDRVYERYLGDLQALYALSLEFERLGVYRLSLQSMAHLLALSPANLVEDGPIFMQRKIYPRPFDELITEQAIANNIDPLLYFSLIRQESLFEEGARSVAAAQGLAQIIPDTGDWIAGQLGYPNYTNDLVYRPIVNVRFGAYYLDWVRDYLDGNLVSALVGYNAGPGNSKRWREISGADDVQFVEILEMYEPRIYVRAIASNLYHYYRLYR